MSNPMRLSVINIDSEPEGLLISQYRKLEKIYNALLTVREYNTVIKPSNFL